MDNFVYYIVAGMAGFSFTYILATEISKSKEKSMARKNQYRKPFCQGCRHFLDKKCCLIKGPDDLKFYKDGIIPPQSPCSSCTHYDKDKCKC